MIRDHFILMLTLAGLLAVFLGVLWRETPRDILRLSLRIFLALTGAAILVGYLMLPLPAR